MVSPPERREEATVQTSVPPTTRRDASCADASSPDRSVATAPLFPPRDADAETYRRFIAASPWPEVVFAAAGHR